MSIEDNIVHMDFFIAEGHSNIWESFWPFSNSWLSSSDVIVQSPIISVCFTIAYEMLEGLVAPIAFTSLALDVSILLLFNICHFVQVA